ncbi:MAG: precorrin-3B C(17)-methyltransferase [Thermoleophilia bacterium]
MDADPDARNISIFSLTAGGALLALRLRDRFGGTAHLPRCHSLGCERCSPFDAIADILPQRFAAGDTVVCVMAAGIVFRLLGPHLKQKHDDPAVIVIDEDGNYVVPLLGGHAAGANRLAAAIADYLGGEAVLTTSSDVQGLTAPDEVARMLGARVADVLELRRVTSLLVNGDEVCIESEQEPCISGYRWIGGGADAEGCRGRLVISHAAGAPEGDLPTVKLVPQRVAAGVGCKRDTPAAEIIAAVEAACADAGIDPLAIGALASVGLKEDEPGLRQAAAAFASRLVFFPAEELDALDREGSDFVRQQTGTAAVSEPAALLAAGPEALLLAGKAPRGKVTTALALAPRSLTLPDDDEPGSIAVVGIGAGSRQSLTREAAAALRKATTVIGYRTYIEQVREIYPDKEFIAGAMGAELDRCREALELARAGGKVALVSSGDAGIYGMAGPLLEMAGETPVTVVPGVTAAQLAAASLGAPLMNDYITISLSDLLTPREEVLRRMEAAARSDMVICLYNPTSRKRRPLFEAACSIIAEHRPGATVVGVVRKAGSADETLAVITLDELALAEVDMRSVVVIGNSMTRVIAGRMVTTRGYEKKKQRQGGRAS